MNTKTLKSLAVVSIIGACLMLVGDYLFFLTPWVSGDGFDSASAMGAMPAGRLMIGGILGPIAGLAYGVGSFLFYVALKRHNKIIAACITALSVLTYSLAGAAHCLFTVKGFSNTSDSGPNSGQVSELVDTMIMQMSAIIGVSAVLSSALLVYMILRYQTVFPKWTVLILPIVLSLAEPLVRPLVPSPLGSIIIGGWPNWSAIVFFAAMLVIWRKQKT